MWLLFACGPEIVEEEPEPYCEEAIPSVNLTADNTCAPIWACCEGDPAKAVQCWYQSGDPDFGPEPGLIWQCASSFASCDSAQTDASFWACFEAPL